MKTKNKVIFFSILAVFSCALSSCSSQYTLALIDKGFDFLFPSCVKSIKKLAGNVIVLPETQTTQAIYSAIESKKPKNIILSPALLPEINNIIENASVECNVIYLGSKTPQEKPRLYSAIFNPEDADKLAAEHLAKKSLKKPAGTYAAAIFASKDNVESRSEQFLQLYKSYGGQGEPIIEISAQGFSKNIADKLKMLDISLVYLAVLPSDIEIWAREAFDAAAWIVAECPSSDYFAVSQASECISWDYKNSLDMLLKKVSKNETGTINGLWSIIKIKHKTVKKLT